jgi:hypothetical protein
MLGRTKKDRKHTYTGMAIATAVLVFLPNAYLWIRDRVPGGQG